ncbi:unnamed protein product [Eruca vesicaria subsp. sativa]|uniref:Uncharacterized protein n=1 Tax=Eruca vesicaria subsp. sativa TaxID=29727 RepID=A0ABC8IQF6_ERUVS|nr:unnamed protein product [Eruca vesicaria subsp. sativa]
MVMICVLIKKNRSVTRKTNLLQTFPWSHSLDTTPPAPDFECPPDLHLVASPTCHHHMQKNCHKLTPNKRKLHGIGLIIFSQQAMRYGVAGLKLYMVAPFLA